MKYLLIVISVLTLLACDGDSVVEKAQVSLMSTMQTSDSTFIVENEQIGEAIVRDKGNQVEIEIRVRGLYPNWSHAVHLHMGNCEQPGHHWNQMTMDNYCDVDVMGEPWLRPKAGDVGNVNTDSNGDGKLTVSSDLWELNTSTANDISGMVLIIHEKPEDFVAECAEQHVHMHNNRKIACGTVELVLND